MFDRDSLIISYDAQRGEPRGSRRRGEDARAAGLGDCIDCTLCVQVCPTGIDIRKGLQYECIACAACIDACDGVMDRMQYPRGLIRYSTQTAMDGGEPHVLRPRTLIYGLLLATLFGLFVWAIATRSSVDLDVIRDRNALYREVPGGRVENVYTVKLLNKHAESRRYALSVSGLEGARLEAADSALLLGAEELRSVAVRVSVPYGGAAPGATDIWIEAVAEDDDTAQARRRTRFFMPDL